MGERRKRSSQADTANWVAFLSKLPIVVDHAPPARVWGETLHLARTHNLSIYDASYLELALRRKLRLATLDEPMKKAAAALGVSFYQP